MLAVATGAASAQHVRKERGFTWDLGVGKGWLTSACSECVARPSDTDLGFQLRAGWKLRNNWIVGAEAYLWSNSKFVANETQEIRYDAVSAIVIWYPWRHYELFLKGGLGITSNTTLLVLSDGNLRSNEFKATPVTGTLGAGLDLNLGKSWSFTPFIDYQNGLSAKAKIDGASSDQKVTTSMVIFGVALTVH
jgi:hypothetical protein